MTNVFMYLKITVHTPNGQAEKTMKQQRDALIGMRKKKDLMDERILDDHTFEWIIPAEDEKDMRSITKRLARGEIAIKEFYKAVIGLIFRVNKLVATGQRGIRIGKTMIKKSGLLIEINKDPKTMSDNEFKEWLKITDLKEMQELLSGPLIEVAYIKP
jgi:hypothetical protein